MVAPSTATQAAATARPEQFTRMELTAVGSRQLELRWNGGGGADEFVIFCGRTEIGRVNGDTRQFVVEGLTTGRTQQFRVEARNKLGSRTIARDVWVPNQELPTMDDFSITVSSKGICTLHLAAPRTNDALRVSYSTASGTYAVTFAAGQTSCRLDGVSRAGGLLELDVTAIRSANDAGAGVHANGEIQVVMPSWRREP